MFVTAEKNPEMELFLLAFGEHQQKLKQERNLHMSHCLSSYCQPTLSVGLFTNFIPNANLTLHLIYRNVLFKGGFAQIKG